MDSENKSILIISSEFPPDPGGIGNHAYNLATHLSAEGFAVIVLADINNTPPDALNVFQQSVPFKFKAIVRKRINVFTYVSRAFNALSLTGRTSYIICSGKFSLWLVLILKLIYPSKRFVAVVHGTELDLKGAISKKLTTASLKKFHAIVAVSSYTQSYLAPQVKSKVRNIIIPNGINNSEFVHYVNEPSLAADKNNVQPSIITIGNVTERKGQKNVILALPAMLKVFPQLHYHIAGKPTNKTELLNLATRLNVAGHITFYGLMQRSELIKLLSGCTVKFMLSNHTQDGDFEGFGIAVLEANALGIPAIGSNFGGIVDAIDNNKTGRLVDINNPEDITEALRQILSGYPSYSANAFTWAHQHDWGIIVKQYIQLLSAI